MALVAADMFLKVNGYYLQRVPFEDDMHNKGLEDAHIAVVTNQWNAEQLGHYYESVAGEQEVGPVTKEIMEFRKNAIEY